MRDPELRRTLLAEAANADPAFAQFLDPERIFPLGHPARLRARRATSLAAQARAAGRTPLEVFYDALMEDDGAALVLRPLLNYSDFNLDSGPRDARAPDERVGPRRRRRALRHHVRREHADVHAHALGARSRRRPAAARMGRAEDDERDRRALRPRRSGRARARHARRLQPHRPRRVSRCTRPRWCTTCRATAAASCRAPTATSRPSSGAK